MYHINSAELDCNDCYASVLVSCRFYHKDKILDYHVLILLSWFANKLSNECVQMLVNGISNIETLHRFIHSCYPYQFTTCSVKPCMILYDIQQWKPKDSRISLERLESRSLMLSNLFAIQQSFYAMIIRTNEVFSIGLGFLRHRFTTVNCWSGEYSLYQFVQTS